jgi:hypothetical protein
MDDGRNACAIEDIVFDQELKPGASSKKFCDADKLERGWKEGAKVLALQIWVTLH